MRRFLIIIILLCLLYFVGGWFAVRWNWWSNTDFLTYSGLVGTLAGLYAASRPAVTQSDILRIESENLALVARSAKEIESLNSQKALAAGELSNLEIQRKEMEILVKKASLALFLKDRYKHYEELVLEEIDKNPSLRESIDKTIEI